MNDTASIVSRVWSFCHTLRDDGVSYGDYLEQFTYLLFLKMDDEVRHTYWDRRDDIRVALIILLTGHGYPRWTRMKFTRRTLSRLRISRSIGTGLRVDHRL